MLELVLSALASKFGNTDTRRVIDDELGITDNSGTFDQFFPVCIGEITGTECLCIDARFEGEQTVNELFFRHLEREDRGTHIFVKRNILRNIQDKRRLTHGRTGGNQNQIGRLKSGGSIIKVNESGRNTGYGSGLLRCFLDLLQSIHYNLSDWNILSSGTARQQCEHIVLRLI